MALYYTDSSALFKRYHPETGTEFIRILMDEQRFGEVVVISSFTSVEITATARRLLKGRVIRQGYYARILARFADDLDNLLSVEPVTEAIVEQARGIAMTYALRAGDALQLATALEIKAPRPFEALAFISADRELVEAAAAAGLNVVNPEDSDALARLRRFRGR